MQEKVLAIIREVTGQNDITVQTDLVRDLQLNSFDVVNIVAAFEEEFDIEIETRQLHRIRTVQDILNTLDAAGLHE